MFWGKWQCGHEPLTDSKGRFLSIDDPCLGLSLLHRVSKKLEVVWETGLTGPLSQSNISKREDRWHTVPPRLTVTVTSVRFFGPSTILGC